MCLYFPRFLGELDVIEPPDTGVGIEDGDGETVLVIDDEDAIRTLLTDVLEEAGYRVLAASNGPGGLKILQSDARVDLLITDVGLPGGVNGRQVADAGRITRPNLKVLFITGYAENAVVGNGHLSPGMHVIHQAFRDDGAGRSGSRDHRRLSCGPHGFSAKRQLAQVAFTGPDISRDCSTKAERHCTRR